MNWIGKYSNVPRALALVYYDPSTQEWHIGDTVISRAVIEHINEDLASTLVAELVGQNAVYLRKAIVQEHTLKDAAYGW